MTMQAIALVCRAILVLASLAALAVEVYMLIAHGSIIVPTIHLNR